MDLRDDRRRLESFRCAGSILKQEGPDCFHSVLDGIAGDVQSWHFKARQRPLQIVQQEAFGAAYVQDPVSRLQPIQLYDVLGNSYPTGVVLVATAALGAFAMKRSPGRAASRPETS